MLRGGSGAALGRCIGSSRRRPSVAFRPKPFKIDRQLPVMPDREQVHSPLHECMQQQVIAAQVVAQLDALLLSHGHYDHFGGMAGFRAAHREKLRPGLPFYLGGEECFCSRETGPADTPSNFGALDRRAIAAQLIT